MEIYCMLKRILCVKASTSLPPVAILVPNQYDYHDATTRSSSIYNYVYKNTDIDHNYFCSSIGTYPHYAGFPKTNKAAIINIHIGRPSWTPFIKIKHFYVVLGSQEFILVSTVF